MIRISLIYAMLPSRTRWQKPSQKASRKAWNEMKQISSTLIWSGSFLRLYSDRLILDNGAVAQRDLIRHPGGAAILLIQDEQILLVRQYRHGAGKQLLEIPAGKREPGEEPFTTAQRELKEEVGATAADWQPLGQIIASPGCYDEVLHLYLARGLTFGDTHPDEDEFLSVRRIPFQELVQRCLSGEIQDGKTVTAVLKAKLLLGL